MRVLLVLAFLLSATSSWGARLIVVPPVISAGEVAWVRWDGPALSSAMIHFHGRITPMHEQDLQWQALVGVDVETVPGTYPLYMVASTPSGHSYNLRVDVTVRGVERPVEHLRLPESMVTPKGKDLLERIAREHDRLASIWEHWSGPLGTTEFVRPVANPVSSVFGKKRILNGVKKSLHSGTDFRSPAGTVVRNPGAGVVVLVDDLYYTGKTVVVDHGGGLFSLMAHLQESLVTEGEIVEEGAPLGRVGSTGRSTGPHLHWTVKLNATRVDPLAVVKAFAAETP